MIDAAGEERPARDTGIGAAMNGPRASFPTRWVTLRAATLAGLLFAVACAEPAQDRAPSGEAPGGVESGDAARVTPPAAAPVSGIDGAAARAGATDPVREGVTTPPPTSPAAPAGSTAAAADTPVPAGAQDAGARAMRAAAAAYERLRSLRASFTMVVENPLLRRTTTSRGTLYQRSPDRIKLLFTDPAGDVIVGDGTYFWIYYPSVDSLQVMRAPAAQAGSGGVDLRAQFVGDPVERFRYTLHGTETVGGREATLLTLVPIADADYRQLRAWIDTQDFLARRFEITEHNGLVRRFDLERLEINPSLDDAIFRFAPPPGARIIERE